ncbi:MAG: Ig-like domain-containing protein [Chitinophagales bacterium]|nr:Ig-like domain-containing protein [Chitinophagales bacterium]MDW8419245.1 Ig-like domain-containing protein [Chitinophagales bacterium]
MKRTLLLLLSAMAATVNAQILNNDFENWATDTIYFPGSSTVPPDTFTAFNPLYWTTSNSISGADSLGGVFFVSRTTDSYSGSYAVRMVTDSIKLPLIPNFPATKLTIPGFIVNGKFPVKAESLVTSGAVISPMAFKDAGQPINQRLGKIKGYYKYAPQFIPGTNSNDTCVVWAVLRKGQKEVANAIFKSTTNTGGNYLPFEADFNYLACDIPDTLVVFCASSVPNVAAIIGGGSSGLISGSDLRIDSLYYTSVPNNFNFAPVANNDQDTTFKNTPKTIQIKANDSDCNDNLTNLTINIVLPPNSGSVNVSPSNAFVVYTPNNNYVGVDEFFYTLSDGSSTSSPARVRVLVLDGAGIANENLIAVNMYPVPAADLLHVSYEYPLPSIITVTDAIGRQVLRTSHQNGYATIQTTTLTNGIYFIHITDIRNTTLAKMKFVVNR